MWSAGYCAGAGLGGFLLMTGLWVGLLIVVVWAVSRIFPVADRRVRRRSGRTLDVRRYR